MIQIRSKRILAHGVEVSNDSHKTQLNNNDLIIGASGSGKTRGYVIPNLRQIDGVSLIVSDTKKELYHLLKPDLQHKGYNVLCVDFTDCLHSHGYNPLDFIRYDKERDHYSEQDISKVAACLSPVESTKEPFWDYAAKQLLEVLISYCLDCLPDEEHTLGHVCQLFRLMGNHEFDRLIEELAVISPESFAVRQYEMIRGIKTADKMDASIKGVLAEKLDLYTFDGIQAMFTVPDRVNFAHLRDKKTAIFVNMSDTDRSLDKIVSLFFTQALQTLCNSTNAKYPVWLILDDFAAGTKIPDFDRISSVTRSRNIYLSVMLQSISQLEELYGPHGAKTIINNFDHLLYLGGSDVSTSYTIAHKANKPVNCILNLPLSDAWLFTRGSPARQVMKYYYKTDTEHESSL